MEPKIVTRNYTSRMLREGKADLCGWVFDGMNYIVKVRLHHNREIVHVIYKEFPTYLTKKYETIFSLFMIGV